MENKPSIMYIAGFFVGLALCAVIFFLIRKLTHRQGSKYDERQQLVRGQCYQAAFWVLAAYLAANGIFNLLTGVEWGDSFTVSFVGFCLAVTVFVVLCIRRDAYFSLNEKPRFYIILFTVIVVIELAATALYIFKGDSFLTDGQLNFRAMNLVIVGMYAVVLPAMLWRLREQKRDEE